MPLLCLRVLPSVAPWWVAALLALDAGSASANVSVQISAPSGQTQVLELQTPVPVTAMVKIDGLPVSNGTPVHWSSSSLAGSFAASSSPTVSGRASTVLRGMVPGAHSLRAEAEVAGQRYAATYGFYLRQLPSPLELLVPAYFYPSNGSGWEALAAAASAYPELKVTAILNPSNGIFTTAQARYVQAAQKFVDAGGQLLGYVYTNYGRGPRTLADVQTNVDRYLELYGRELISGIFVDEMSNKTSELAFYQALYRYIKDKDPSLRVVGNPGTIPATRMATVADALITFEGQALNFANYDPRRTGPWLYHLSNTRQGALVHNASTCTAMQTALKRAASAQANSGLVYITHRQYDYATNTGNPWASLPTYWTALLQSLQALNQGQALPAC
jgi:hypothetical protein